jgi:hypothetical protein
MNISLDDKLKWSILYRLLCTFNQAIKLLFIKQIKPNLIAFFSLFVQQNPFVVSKFKYEISPRALCGITLRIFKNY